MRAIFTGSRDWADEAIVRSSLERIAKRSWPPTIVVGDCKTGVDEMVSRWCGDAGCEQFVYRADCDTHGKAAGPMRNAAMVTSGGDICIGFVDMHTPSRSVGTRGCLMLARTTGINTHAYVAGLRTWMSGSDLDDWLHRLEDR